MTIPSDEFPVVSLLGIVDGGLGIVDDGQELMYREHPHEELLLLATFLWNRHE